MADAPDSKSGDLNGRISSTLIVGNRIGIQRIQKRKIMGTAAICFLFSLASLLAFLLPHFPHSSEDQKFWIGYAVVWSIPSLASMFFWFFAGMIFLWMQRIRDAINATTKAVEKLRRDGIDARIVPTNQNWPPSQ